MENVGIFDKEVQWEPYSGPRGGEGYRNPDTGEVVYDEIPPNTTTEPDRDTINVEDSIDIEYEGQFLSQDQLVSHIEGDFERVKEKSIVENVTEGVGQIRSMPGNTSYYNRDSGDMMISQNTFEGTVTHEVGHAMLGENGFNLSPAGNLLAASTNALGNNMPDDLMEMTVGEMIEYVDEEAGMADSYKGFSDEIKDQPISPDQFKIEIADDANSSMVEFVESVNEVFEDQFSGAFGDGESQLISDSYAATNAHETFAKIHQEMQDEGINFGAMQVMYEQYPDFCEEYFNIFEPNELQKREFNRLFNDEGSSGPIEDVPFPEELQ